MDVFEDHAVSGRASDAPQPLHRPRAARQFERLAGGHATQDLQRNHAYTLDFRVYQVRGSQQKRLWLRRARGYTVRSLVGQADSVVVLDPEPRSREALVFGFARAGYAVISTGEAGEAFEAAQAKAPQLVVASSRKSSEWAQNLGLIGRLRE